MTSSNTPLTVTSLMATVAEILEVAGFKTIDPSVAGTWRATEARVYEDAYSIVCIAIYETWSDLSSLWVDDQSSLVALISEHFSRTEPKAWDGYLVLLTPSSVPTGARQNAIDIQRNTLYVRKLFASGDELHSTGAVRRILLPLLPLEGHQALQSRNVLDTLPPLLAGHGVDVDASKVAIAAFRDQRSIIAELHAFMANIQRRQP